MYIRIVPTLFRRVSTLLACISGDGHYISRTIVLFHSRRLHEKETNNNVIPQKTPFSALNWLKQEQITDSIVSEQIQDDALYVLGVAGLASKKLLEKHHIPESFVKPVDANEEGAIDVTPAAANKTPVQLAKMIARVTKARQALYAYQTRKLMSLSKVLMRTSTKLLHKMWLASGGKRSLTIAATLATILTIALIRPLLIGIGKESLNMFGSP